MKRHPSLHPLSEHHHHVLVQALDIRRSLEGVGIRRRAKLQQVAEGLLRFWEESGRTHFREEEEEVLLPAYARHVRLDRDSDVMRMLADHAAIRAQIDDVRKMLAGNQLAEKKIATLAQMLHDHVRLEDKVFPQIEEVLDEKELRALGSHLTRLHGKQTP